MVSPVATPTTPDEVAALLADAGRRSARVVPAGGKTKIDWHDDPYTDDAVLTTGGLISGFAHYAGDLVATLPAGMTLAEAHGRLTRERQWLPLDPSFAEQATIGGIVAANDSGPRRHRYGAPRDLIVGIEVALADGRVVRAGGRVVKNVAGYDLSRLFCGSHGSLGVITSATFKLAPVPPESRTLVARFATVAAALEGVQALTHSALTPTAVELRAPEAELLVRFETTPKAAGEMAAAARTLLKAEVQSIDGDAETQVWREHHEPLWGGCDAICKVGVLPMAIAQVLPTRTDVRWYCRGRAALGVLLIGCEGSGQALVTFVNDLRAAAAAAGGYLGLLRAPADVRNRVVLAAAPAAAVMHAVKERFDPRHVLRRVADGV